MSDPPVDIAVQTVRVTARSGRVKIVARPITEVEVVGDRATVRREGSRTTVDTGSNRVEVRIPEGADVVVGTTAGRVEIEGVVGDAAIVTESGRVWLADAADVDVRTTSGRVEVGRSRGHARIRSKSGRVTIDAAGTADVATKSGRVELRSVTGSTVAHCVSGRIDVVLAAAADVEAETVSGRITIRVPRSATPELVEGPRPDGPRSAGCDCTIVTRSVSGRVQVENQ